VTLATLALVRTSLACVPQVSGLQARLRPILRGREMADAAWPGQHGHRRSPQERQMAEGQSVFLFDETEFLCKKQIDPP